MRRSVRTAILAAALLLPGALTAQLRVQAGGGFTTPMSDFSDLVESGIQGRAGLSFGVPLFPLSVRAEGEYSRFPRAGAADGHTSLLGGSASAVLTLGGIGLSPYVIAGVGRYRTDFSDEFGPLETTTETGYHGGFGVNIGLVGLGGWVEARLVNISRDAGTVRALPVTLGLRF